MVSNLSNHKNWDRKDSAGYIFIPVQHFFLYVQIFMFQAVGFSAPLQAYLTEQEIYCQEILFPWYSTWNSFLLPLFSANYLSGAH